MRKLAMLFNGFRRTSLALVSASFVVLMMCSAELSAVRNRYYDDEHATVLKEMRDTLDDVRHEVNNHESEIRVYDEKLKSLESIIDGVRDQLMESSQAYKEQLKGNSVSLESKITAIETSIKGLVADLRQFKTHANDSSIALAQYKQKISELEKIVEHQNQNIDHLHTALRTLTEALVVKDSPQSTNKTTNVAAAESTPPGTYRVKTGDSLEKIARNHQTTVAAIKELNGLTHDRIGVNQLLRIPEK
jgi:LysM repeat protein